MVYGEGKHYRIPFLQRPVKYHGFTCFHGNVTYRLNDEPKEEIKLKLQILANPVPEHLPHLYRQIGDNFNSFMGEKMNEAFVDVIPKCSIKQVLSKEEFILEDIKKRLSEKLDGLNIYVEEVLYEGD